MAQESMRGEWGMEPGAERTDQTDLIGPIRPIRLLFPEPGRSSGVQGAVSVPKTPKREAIPMKSPLIGLLAATLVLAAWLSPGDMAPSPFAPALAQENSAE